MGKVAGCAPVSKAAAGHVSVLALLGRKAKDGQPKDGGEAFSVTKQSPRSICATSAEEVTGEPEKGQTGETPELELEILEPAAFVSCEVPEHDSACAMRVADAPSTDATSPSTPPRGAIASGRGRVGFGVETPAHERAAPGLGGNSCCSGDMSKTAQLLLISWNCAGFPKAQNLIRAHYGGLSSYLQRLGAAIFCLQETKLLPSSLQNMEDGKKVGAVLPGYQSFWAFNELKGRLSGFNGVATWVRDDVVAALGGVRATQDVLRDPLDREGRCLLLDLGGLAILNVYAPRVDGEGAQEQIQERILKKVKFFELLRRRMDELKGLGKRVILCGDLNVTLRSLDCMASRRCLQVIGGCIAGRENWPAPPESAHEAWVRVGDVAKALRVSCSAPSTHVEARLDSLSKTLEVIDEFTLGGKPIAAGRVLLMVNGECVSSVEEVRRHLREGGCDARIEFGVPEAALANCAEPAHAANEQECVQLVRSMLFPSGSLVDTFARAHPQAENRFTCWNQSLNLRYVNIGTRLDYILCDTELAESLVVTPTYELAGASKTNAGGTAAAALSAATCSGRWHEAPRKELYGDEAGLSIQQDDMQLNNTQFRDPHTGMLYTPPSYSDHIPVCALFRTDAIARGTLSLTEKETRSCTPWVAQPGLTSFFAQGSKKRKLGN